MLTVLSAAAAAGDLSRGFTLRNRSLAAPEPEPPSACCDGQICCDMASESCCLDPTNDAVCCINDPSFCCPPQGSFPSRCCPIWFVCSLGTGRYGCADPAGGIYDADGLRHRRFRSAAASLRRRGLAAVEARLGVAPVNTAVKAGAADSVMAAFLIPGWLDTDAIYSFPVSVPGAARGSAATVTGPYNDWGEMTPIYAWDSERQVYYTAQANLTGLPPNNALVVYAIDAKSGVSTMVVVPAAGKIGAVTGYDYAPAIRRLIVATAAAPGGGATNPPTFWAVDVATGAATVVGRGAAGDGAPYAGFFHDCAPDGSAVYRLGFLDPVGGTGSGLGITKLPGSAAVATTTWTNVPMEAGPSYAGFTSLSIIPARSSADVHCFVSLAPSATLGDLGAFTWCSDKPGNITQIASFGNAHLTPTFGPLVEAVSPDSSTYAAFVVRDEPDSNYDLWALAVVPLDGSGAGSNTLVTPYMLAQTDGPCVLGFPQ